MKPPYSAMGLICPRQLRRLNLRDAAEDLVHASGMGFLVHGRDRNKNLHVYSLLGLSTHKNVKCYPTMTKV